MRHIYTIAALLFCGLTTIEMTAQCFEDGHSTFANDGWLSCNTSIGPIPERGDQHWVMYDFGEVYAIDSLHIWNHNVWGETGSGAKEILIDYSTDQESWNSVGPYTIDQAPGSWRYRGADGPTLEGGIMRYILITVLSTWDESSACAGLAEVRFDIGEYVAVDEAPDNTEWTLGPNPAYEVLNISIPKYEDVASIEIHDAIGRLMHRLGPPSSDQLVIPVHDYQDGLYFLSIYTLQSVTSKTFVKG